MYIYIYIYNIYIYIYICIYVHIYKYIDFLHHSVLFNSVISWWVRGVSFRIHLVGT